MLLKVGWFVALFTVLTAGVSVAIATQQQIKKNNIVMTETKARIAVSDQEWATVKEQNLELLAHDPKDPDLWFMLGLARHYLGEYDQSRKDWLQAKDLGNEPGIVHYNLACSYARENDTEKVIENIKESKEFGFNVREFAESDPDLANMRNNPEFQKAVGQSSDKDSLDLH